jgi:ribonuclease HI
MLYGAEVWLALTRQREKGTNRRGDRRVAVKKLGSIQLKAARLIVGGMASSPGDLLDAHADLPPIHLTIDRLLQKAAVRYATLPKTHPLHAQIANVARYGHVKKHPSPLHFLMTAYKDVRQGKVETIRPVRRKAGWKAPVEVRVAASKEEAKEWALAETSRVQLFSDGSLIDGKVGAAAVLMVDGVVKRQKGVCLGSERRYGVYEAEGIGEVLALECLKEEQDTDIRGTIPLGIDNTSALYATTDAKTGVGRYIWDYFHKTLRETRATHPDFALRLDWTPGHVEIPGNETADEAAKRAALEGSFGATTVAKRLPYSKSALVLTHARLLQDTAKKEFKRTLRYQRIKDVDDSTPSAGFRRLTTNLPRKHASLLFQLRSHHVPLARHLHRLKKSPSPNCPCCEMADETVAHFLFFCPAHDDARRAMYANSVKNQYLKYLLNDPDHLPALFTYVQRTCRFHSVFGDFKPIEPPTKK